jgi:hypothetical protein
VPLAWVSCKLAPDPLNELQIDFPLSEDTIRAELENYKAFFANAGQSEQELPVPNLLLLDLVWHTHMFYPVRYANECVRIAGHFIDHDDASDHGDEVGH